MNLASLLVLLLQAPGPVQAVPERLPRADPVVQAAIRGVLEANSVELRRSALEALRAQAGARHERLVPQLFLLLQQATDTREGMAFGVLAATLPIPPRDVIAALVPLLESEDRGLRAALGNVLAEYEDRSAERGASFTVYREFLGQGASHGLVRHLFETDPGAALLELAQLEVHDPAELRALLWAEHEVADSLWKLERGFVSVAEPEALTELAGLARHPRWWARLYALAVAERAPALRAGLPLAELREDEHAWVRAAAGASPR